MFTFFVSISFLALVIVITISIVLGIVLGNIPLAFFIMTIVVLALAKCFKDCKSERPSTIARRDAYNRRNSGNFTGGVEVKNPRTGKYQY